jgi:uncharacterized protein (DUF1778 family)
MVTKLADGRGQVTLKGHEITDEWEELVRKAAKRNGQSVAAFVATFTTEAAQAILKGQSAVPSAVPARLEDVADALSSKLTEALNELRREQSETTERLARKQSEAVAAAMAETLAKLERQARRGRWR